MGGGRVQVDVGLGGFRRLGDQLKRRNGEKFRRVIVDVGVLAEADPLSVRGVEDFIE